jgi:hypothetical protein
MKTKKIFLVFLFVDLMANSQKLQKEIISLDGKDMTKNLRKAKFL